MYARWLLGGVLLALLTACPGGDSAGGDIGGTVSLGRSIIGSRLQPGDSSAALHGVRYVPGEVLVQFKGEVSLQSVGALQVALNGQMVELQQVRALGLPNTLLYRANVGEAETPALAEALRLRADVAAAEPNRLDRLWLTPNDEYYPDQWHYPAINLPQAWDRTTGSASVVVAVLDSGILFRQGNPAQSHPDLAGRVLAGYDMISDPRNAEDGNGRDPDPFDSSGNRPEVSQHGSHVAGTIGAATNNNTGVAGVDWNAKLLPVRVCGALGCALADQIDAILWAGGRSVAGLPNNSNPAQVINMSLGGPGACSSLQQQAIDDVSELGTVVVVAAGNENDDASRYSPANCVGVITVGATDIQNRRSYYSNYGGRVDVMAPGGDVRKNLNGDRYVDGVLSLGFDTTDNSFDYIFLQGTSMASPHVAGVVALMKALRSNLTSVEALQALKNTARPLSDANCEAASSQDPQLPKGDNRSLTGLDCGAGLIDASAALQAVANGNLQGFELALNPASLRVSAGSTASVQVGIRRSGGFAGAVNLSVVGLPSGFGAVFSPASASADSSTLSLSVPAGASGRYSLVIRGASGSLTRTSVVNVVVGSTQAPSVRGTVVLACFIAGDDCDPERSKEGRIGRDGTSVPYLLEGLSRGDYVVLALKDANGNNKLDQGDYLGAVLDASGDLAVVRPGNRTADIEMVLLSGGIGFLSEGKRTALERSLGQR